MLADLVEHESSETADRRGPRNLARMFPSARHVGDLRRNGYLVAHPDGWDTLLGDAEFEDWTAFAESWDRLDLDLWMGDGGRYRRRRFAAFSVQNGSVGRKPHQPHFQGRLHNPLNGGMERWFSPVERAIGDHGVTIALLRAGAELTSALAGWREGSWHAEMHQFRISADRAGTGIPTPEGLHRDGAWAVLMLLVGRHNVKGGVTTITEDRRFNAEVSLTRPLQGIFLDDNRLCHRVSPIQPILINRPAWRDALVVTYRPNPT